MHTVTKIGLVFLAAVCWICAVVFVFSFGVFVVMGAMWHEAPAYAVAFVRAFAQYPWFAVVVGTAAAAFTYLVLRRKP
ncbi:hypothetical protein HY480_04590 [Candidatus Uhrbacteria bacterium]|nr:hypothetical protein [Candidatus Uhrbacteria bacterium]